MDKLTQKALQVQYQGLRDRAILRLQQTNLRSALKYLAEIASRQGTPYSFNVKDPAKETGLALIEIEVEEDRILVYLQREDSPRIKVYEDFKCSVSIFKDDFWVQKVVEAYKQERITELQEKIDNFTPL